MKHQRTYTHTDDEVKPSRTRKKRDAEASQKIGEQLLDLSEEKLQDLQLPTDLHEAVMDAHIINSRGALRRQLQYIGSLMRHIDAQKLKQDLERIAFPAHREARSFKQAEQWRDELVSGDQARLMWLLENFSAIDKDLLLRLVDDVRNNTAATERRRAGRALFRFLRPLADLSVETIERNP